MDRKTSPDGRGRKKGALAGAPDDFDFEFFRVRREPGYGWIMDRPPAVVIVPLAPGAARVWLAHIERVPTRSRSWELPGGGIDEAESAVRAGLRELEEECGLVATEGARALRPVLELAPGMGRFPHHVVVARGVVPARGGRPIPQRDEGIMAVRNFARHEIHGLIARGHISVHATLAALTACGWLLGPTDENEPRRRTTSSGPNRARRPASRR